jgi:hypothetical protein
MSSSLFIKPSTLLHAIAITLILATLSGYVPLQSLSAQQLQSALQVNLPLGK